MLSSMHLYSAVDGQVRGFAVLPTLNIAKQTEAVDVVATAPLVESQSSHIAQTVSREMIAALPLPNRAASCLWQCRLERRARTLERGCSRDVAVRTRVHSDHDGEHDERFPRGTVAAEPGRRSDAPVGSAGAQPLVQHRPDAREEHRAHRRSEV